MPASVSDLKEKILKPNDDFDSLALEIFRYQSVTNPVYKRYLEFLNIKPGEIKDASLIPFLPIGFFKTHRVLCEHLKVEKIFTSSGTTGQEVSSHYVSSLSFYKKVFMQGFQQFYGKIEDYCLLALLPSYLERKGSSLVYMAGEMIRESNHAQSGFYLHDLHSLYERLVNLEKCKQKVLLLGVTYALLDLAEQYPIKLKHAMVMETGGMKGKRREMVREEVHQKLKKAFGLPAIHSEYGMTELMSQAWSKGDGIFICPPWMNVSVKDIHDPLGSSRIGTTGTIHIMDLANIDTCAFIATEDLGRVHENGNFEITGRIGNSDLRGCNLLLD